MGRASPDGECDRQLAAYDEMKEGGRPALEEHFEKSGLAVDGVIFFAECYRHLRKQV